ncbi:hypothetical protein J6P92_01840 [bacterium]|nr:hypothetical protein [bacterium]
MKYLKNLIVIFLLFMGVSVSAETLKAGVSVDLVPDTFYGSWRVAAKVSKQSGSMNFRPQTVDFWNLSRSGNVINLSNPFTGAEASVNVDYVEGNMIRFTKKGSYDFNKILTDTVDIKLSGDTFTGINSLILETYSPIDGKLVKTDTAVYILKGEKISGTGITGK